MNQNRADFGIAEESRFQGFGITPALRIHPIKFIFVALGELSKWRCCF
jgi:hypothetical protein